LADIALAAGDGLFSAHYLDVQVLEKFWEHQRSTEFFKNHPILSNPAP